MKQPKLKSDYFRIEIYITAYITGLRRVLKSDYFRIEMFVDFICEIIMNCAKIRLF